MVEGAGVLVAAVAIDIDVATQGILVICGGGRDGQHLSSSSLDLPVRRRAPVAPVGGRAVVQLTTASARPRRPDGPPWIGRVVSRSGHRDRRFGSAASPLPALRMLARKTVRI